nr:extracellular solute-binding protein [Clostridia bacterium]
MATFAKLQDLTNVQVNWVVVSSDGWNDRINLTMASNDLPDAIIKGVPNITRSSADGSIIALNGLIDAYAPGIRALFDEYPAVENASTSPDGNLYAVPQVNTLEPNRTGHRNIWINKTWMDKLGLSMPATTDEFLDVLRAFRDGDPNGNGVADEIPYVVEDSGGGRTGRPDIIASFFGAYSNMGYDCIQVVDGTVSFLKTDPVWREVLEYMNVMWADGLLDNEVFTQSPDASLGKFSNGNSGAFGLSSD